jgi:dephospho-CoA kinase
LRAQLASLVHPKVYEAFDFWVKDQTAPYVIFESALLLEGGNVALFDSIWVVEAPLSLRLSRLQARGLSRETAMQRIDSQWTDEQRRKYADVVWNNDEVSDIMLKVYDIHSKLT